MNPLDTALFGLDAPADPPAALPSSHHLGTLQGFLDLVNRTAVLQGEMLLCLSGLALLLFLLAPARHERAVERLGTHGLRSFLLGSLALLALLAALIALVAGGIRPGRPLLLILLVAGAASGLSVCARALGERALPDRDACTRTCVGLIALVLPLACLPGWPVLLVAAPLGLGAWIWPAPAATSPAGGDLFPQR